MRQIEKLSLILLLSASAAGCAEEPAAAPATHSLGVRDLPPPPSGNIRGQLVVAPALQDKVQPGDTIYLMARNAATGGVIAVSRLSAQAFPMSFELNGSHVMRQGGSLSGKVKLQARVDKDGDAMSKNPGDVVGEVQELVAVPAEGVTLTLDGVL